MYVVAFLTAVCIFLTLATVRSESDGWDHGWETAGSMLWADFFDRTSSAMTTEQLTFVANTYGIVSLEKCWTAGGFTANELAIPSVASALRAINPKIRVLYYFHSLVSFGGCYLASDYFSEQPQCESVCRESDLTNAFSICVASLATGFLLNDAGVPYEDGGAPSRPFYDLNQSAVRDFVAAASVNASHADVLLDGVFADGANSQVNTLKGMSPARFASIEESHRLSLNETRASVHARMRPGAVLIANGISNYPIDGSQNIPYVDGFCFEQ